MSDMEVIANANEDAARETLAAAKALPTVNEMVQAVRAMDSSFLKTRQSPAESILRRLLNKRGAERNDSTQFTPISLYRI